MKYTIQTTTHKLGIQEQREKLLEETEELLIAIKSGVIEDVIDEAIDVSKSSLKLAEIACVNIIPSLDDMIKLNDKKNEKRGYHDEKAL